MSSNLSAVPLKQSVLNTEYTISASILLETMHKKYNHFHIPYIKYMLLMFGFSYSTDDETATIKELKEYYQEKYKSTIHSVNPPNASFTYMAKASVFLDNGVYIVIIGTVGESDDISEFTSKEALFEFIKTENLKCQWIDDINKTPDIDIVWEDFEGEPTGSYGTTCVVGTGLNITSSGHTITIPDSFIMINSGTTVSSAGTQLVTGVSWHKTDGYINLCTVDCEKC